MRPMAVRPMATPTSTRRRVGSAIAARAGESGCSRRVTKTQAASMKRPRQAASIAYSGQWRVTAPPAPSRTGSRRSCPGSRPRRGWSSPRRGPSSTPCRRRSPMRWSSKSLLESCRLRAFDGTRGGPVSRAPARGQDRPHQPLRDLGRHGGVGLGRRPREPDRVGVAAEVRHALRAIVEGVESETGDRFFASLERHLASALGAQYAFVSELSHDRKRFRTRALWGRGAFLPNIDVPLAGTPCEGVLHGQMSHFPERLQELFPTDRALGDWRVHSYCGVPLVDPAGVVVGHLAICDDEPMWDGPRGLSIMRIFAARARAEISRLGAERMLRESEALYRDLYEHAPLAYFTFGSDGRLRRWNARGREMIGYTDEELRGMRTLDFHTDAPENREAFARLEREVFQEGRDLVAEVEARRKDGTIYWARVSLSPLRDDQGRITGARSIAQDVTELRQAQQAVRESEARLSVIIQFALDPIIVTDQEGRIVLINPAGERVFRCAAADVIGTPVMRFGTPEAARSLAQAMEDIRAGRKTFSFSEPGLKSRRLDGEEFEFEGALSCAQVGGRPLYTIYLRDLGERRRLEAEQQRLQLQSAYRSEEHT